MSLEQDLSELSAEVQFVEVSAKRAISGDQFAQGIIDFDLSVSGHSVWHVGRSYIRLTCSLSKAGNANIRPSIADCVAMAYNMPGNLFTQAFLKAQTGGLISSVQQNYAQVAALTQRTLNSDSWAKAQGYVSILNGDFTERQLMCAGSVNLAVVDPLSTRQAALPWISEKPGNQYITRSMNPAAGFGRNNIESTAQTVTCARAPGATVFTFPQLVNAVAGFVQTPTVLTQGLVGTLLVVNGVPYPIVDATATTVTTNAEPPGAVLVPETADWYFVARDYVRGDLLNNTFDILFRPALGLFVQNEGRITLASGEYQLTLNPSANYKLAAIETTNPYAGTAQYNLTIQDMRLYACYGKVNIPPSIISMNWVDYDITSRVIGSGGGGSYQFSVKPSTCKLYVFLQSGAAGSNPNWVPSSFRANNNTDLMIQNLTVTYAGESQPLTQINSATSFVGGATPLDVQSTNTFKQLYYNYITALGVVEREAGVETYQQWFSRGMIHCFDFSTRDMTDRSTQVDVKLTLQAPAGSVADAETQLFVVSEYKKVVEMSVGKGKMVAMKVSSD